MNFQIKEVLFCALFIYMFFSCSEGDLTNDEVNKAQYAELVSSYTAGFVSSQSGIKIKFAKSIDGITPGTMVEDKLFRFQPSMNGKTYWEDSRTLVFQPESGLESGQKYKAVLLLNRIMETGPDKKEFQFAFECIPQNFEVKVVGLSLYDDKDLSRVKIIGTIQSADITTDEQIESIISAQQKSRPLQISFEHNLQQNKHTFTIEEVVREDTPGDVVISWDGDPIGVDKKENLEFPIPSLSDYSITAVQLVRGNPDYVSILFSDPIDSEQNLRGAVWMSKGTDPRVVVELNEIKVYPTSQLNGQVEINISRLVKNVAGFGLKDDHTVSITFSTLKPQIRMAAKSGTIMPNSEGLIIPFEAVSLSAVDLTVVKIFENNIIQYLQNHDIGDGTYWNLRHVARPVARKTIPLGASGAVDLTDWNRFTLDLSNYVDVEPGALYQVRLNFRRGYSLYSCIEETNDINFVQDLEFEQSMDWNEFYDDYYYYDWKNRESPCHKAYYTSENIVEKMVFASDYGIIAKKSESSAMLVFVTNLVSTDYISGVQVDIFDYQQQPIGSGSTDSEGKASIEVSGTPFALVATKGDGVGYLKVNEGSALSVSNFNVTGAKIQKGIKGFLYGERGVWRPADTLHLAFILEDVDNRLPEGHPVILEMYNPMGQLYSRTVKTTALHGIYTFKVLTRKEDPTGNWRAKVKVGGTDFYKQIKIETVKPNRLKMELDFVDDKLYASNGPQKASIRVRWLHGATARNLKVSYEVLLAPIKTSFKGYENFNFDDPRKAYTTEVQTIFDGRVNQDGKADISFNLEAGKSAPGMLSAIFRGKAFEEGGDFSIDKKTISYAPYQHFVGMTVPENDRWGRLMADTDHTINLATVDAKGKAVGRNLLVELYKIRWRWWWDNSYENASSYTSRSVSEKISTGSAVTSNGKGTYNLRVARDWGRYYLKVTDPVSGHSTGKVFYLTYPGWGSQVRGQLGGVTMLDFSVEKEQVNVGEDIQVTFPSSAGSKALVSLENGSNILQTLWVDTQEENTTINIPSTKEMAPNVFVNITLIQKHSQTINDLPMRLYGIQRVGVINPATVLNPEIIMPGELKPGERFTMNIKETEGKPMAYTIAIVEDGLLDLTQFKTPDSWKTFYAQEALGVKSWDVYDDVMGTYGGRIEKLLAIGGDDEIKGPDEDEANRFKPVVMYQGPFFLAPGDTQSHTFRMPEYIGSVRAMVVAGYEGTYGKSEKTIPVKQPLMVLATLPRVAGPKEEIVLPVNVFAMDETIKNVSIKVEAEGNLSLTGSGTSTLQFSESGDKVTYFQLKASEMLGKGKVIVTATSGELTAKFEVELMVRPGNPLMTQVEETILEAGNSWSMEYNPLGIVSTNEGVLEISTLPPLNLEQRMQYLIQYPHGCVEQTTSSVFAQLYLDDLMDLTTDRANEVQRNINAAIQRLRQFQLASGAFSYWPGSSQPSFWGTNYAGHFLLEAKKQGYLVPEDILAKWKNFQLSEANSWNYERYNDYLVQTYRLYVLSMAGSPALGAMNRLKENSSLNKRAKWSLASAYATMGLDKAAREIIDGLNFDSDTYREMGGTYGSTERDKAMILETMIKLGRESEAFELVKQIAGYMSNRNQWMSTQTTAYCLIGIAEFTKRFAPGESVNVSVTIANNDFRVDGNRYLNQVTIIEPDKAASVKVVNRGTAPLFVKMIRTGVPLEGMESAKESGLNLRISYQTTNGRILDPSKIEQGTDFIAKVTIVNPGTRGDYEEMAITQIFPSGWEILNTRLDDTNQFFQEDVAEYKDIRDDRVMTYFDLRSNESKTFKVLLNASYQGKYYLPAVQVEAMYDNSISANTEGQWVEVMQQE